MPRRLSPQDLLVAESPAMRAVVHALEALAGSRAPVLMRGEPGSGRERMARALHDLGPRQDASFTVVQAQLAPAPTLLARSGTLLIRDIEEVPWPAQERLHESLSARPAHEPGPRVVAACDTDLSLAASAGLFHAGLFHLLSAHVIEIPPLRERLEDIVPLYGAFVRGYAAALGRGRMSISSRVHERLVGYPWPGNVAELKRVARHSVVRAAQSRIEPGDIDAILPVLAERAPLERTSFEDMVRSKLAGFLRTVEGYPLHGLYDDVLARVERALLSLVMEHTGGNQVRAAEILGLNRNTLRRKLGERGLLARPRAVLRTKTKGNQGRRADKGDARSGVAASRSEPNG